jgi:hypothetical protein
MWRGIAKISVRKTVEKKWSEAKTRAKLTQVELDIGEPLFLFA